MADESSQTIRRRRAAAIESTAAALKEQPILPPQPEPEVPFRPTAQLYKDLCVFEDRLKSNLRVLRRRQRKYQAAGLTLLSVFITSLYWIYVSHSTDGYVPLSTKCLTLGFGITLTLFLNTKRYRVAVDNASHYVPRCNKTLRTFNMSFHDESPGRLVFGIKVPAFVGENLSVFRELYNHRKQAAHRMRRNG